jgi:hypothetical protein
MRKLLLIALSGCVAGVVAETVPLERYKSLVERYPFGMPPPDFDPNKMASSVSKSPSADAAAMTEQQAAIVKNITFSVINVDSAGVTWVGFTDNSDQKQPHHYYMEVGETRNGWTVKEADPSEKTMTVEKDGVEVALELGGNSAGGGSTGKNAGRALAGDRSPLLGGTGAQFGSFKTRRARREKEAAENEARRIAAEEERRKLAEAEAIEREKERLSREEERAEQRRQLEAIRDELRRSRENRNANGGEVLD